MRFYDLRVTFENISFLFREFLIMKTTFSYFPGMFENLATEKYLYKNEIKNITKYELYTNVAKDNR